MSLGLWLKQDFGDVGRKEEMYYDPAARKEFAAIRYMSGLDFYERGKFANAKGNWLDALRLDPDHSDAKAKLELLEKEHPGL